MHVAGSGLVQAHKTDAEALIHETKVSTATLRGLRTLQGKTSCFRVLAANEFSVETQYGTKDEGV
jgi:hypothetical protein